MKSINQGWADSTENKHQIKHAYSKGEVLPASFPTFLPGRKVKMKGGHLGGPFLGAGLGELLEEGGGCVP